MDLDVPGFVAHFKQLDKSARRTAYHQIIDQLDPYEWRDVRKRINERSFQKDILGILPLEIAVQIIKYLSLNDAHLLRRVSKRWYDVLSSRSACGVLLRLYIGVSFTSLGDDFKSTLIHYSRRRRRLEHGNPLAEFRINLPFTTGQEILSLDYSDGRYAWLTDGDTTIVVYNLCTQKTQRFCARNRERLEKLRISEYIVAALSTRGLVDTHLSLISTLSLKRKRRTGIIADMWQLLPCLGTPNRECSHYSTTQYEYIVFCRKRL